MGNICNLIRVVSIFLNITLLFHVSLAKLVSNGDFFKDFYVTWGPNHAITSKDGRSLDLKLRRDTGCGLSTRKMYLFGTFNMQIKLIPGNSSGTVVGVQLNSDQPKRDGISLEFLGREPGKPSIIQTNIIAYGDDDKEQRVKLWFDATQDFHSYSIFWNPYHIVFLVDGVPIRTYRNHEDKGVAYLRNQPMSMKMSIWNGEGWATKSTDGKTLKIDWSRQPFIATFKDHKIDACVWKGNHTWCSEYNPSNWWSSEKKHTTLTRHQKKMYKRVRENDIVYDYCNDTKRFKSVPKECFLPHY